MSELEEGNVTPSVKMESPPTSQDMTDINFSFEDFREPTTEVEARARSEFTIITMERGGAPFVPADGGCHAWVVCASTFLSYGLVDMSVNIFGLILASIKPSFSASDVTFKLCERFQSFLT